VRWNQGREVIDRMLADSELQRVPASREHADRLVLRARVHLVSANEISEGDPAGGYTLVYDAARKALTAVLENQGLRPTTRGGHLAVHEATRAQLDPPMGQVLRPFDRIRRQRHDVEDPPIDAPQVNADDVREDAIKAAAIVDLSERVLDQMSPF
jgi:hypothetical protein